MNQIIKSTNTKNKKNMTNIRTHDLSSILFFLLICFFVCLLRERVIRVMFLIYDQITRAATTHRIRIRKLENESSCVVCIDCNIIVILLNKDQLNIKKYSDIIIGTLESYM